MWLNFLHTKWIQTSVCLLLLWQSAAQRSEVRSGMWPGAERGNKEESQKLTAQHPNTDCTQSCKHGGESITCTDPGTVLHFTLSQKNSHSSLFHFIWKMKKTSGLLLSNFIQTNSCFLFPSCWTCSFGKTQSFSKCHQTRLLQSDYKLLLSQINILSSRWQQQLYKWSS